MKSIKIWDLPTRVFHWSLAVFVLAAYLTSSGRPHGVQYLLHITSGYAVTLLVLFRIAWGFFGGEHACFAAFLRGWRAAKAHARSLLRLSPERTLGHNAIGGWMIMLMLILLFLIVVTGMLAQGKTGGAGPLTAFVPRPLVFPLGDVHSFLGTAILVLAGVHVAAVLFESLLNRENLVRAMVTGEKPAAEPGVRDARAAPLWRAAFLMVLLAAVGGYMLDVTRLPPQRAAAPVSAVADD